MNMYSVESMLLSFVMYASHQGVKHVTNSGIKIQKEFKKLFYLIYLKSENNSTQI